MPDTTRPSETTSNAISNHETRARTGSMGMLLSALEMAASIVIIRYSFMPMVAAPCWPSSPFGRKIITIRNNMKKKSCPNAGAT